MGGFYFFTRQIRLKVADFFRVLFVALFSDCIYDYLIDRNGMRVS